MKTAARLLLFIAASLAYTAFGIAADTNSNASAAASLPAVARAVLLGEGSAPADASGHGLGLATVRALAAAVGATIAVGETPGEGATIVLRLPPA